MPDAEPIAREGGAFPDRARRDACGCRILRRRPDFRGAARHSRRPLPFFLARRVVYTRLSRGVLLGYSGRGGRRHAAGDQPYALLLGAPRARALRGRLEPRRNRRDRADRQSLWRCPPGMPASPSPGRASGR